MTCRNVRQPDFVFEEVYPEAGPLEAIDEELGRFYKANMDDSSYAHNTRYRQTTIEVHRRIFSVLKGDPEAGAVFANMVIFVDMKNKCAD